MTTWDLTALLNAADAHASLPERHIWMVRLFEWLRHGQATVDAPGDATPAPVLRLRQLCQVLERHDDLRARVQGVLGSFLREVDAVTLLADFGFAPRASFASELARRIGAKLLPKTPDTRNLAELFGLIFKPSDESWISRIDDATLARLAGWWPQGHLRWREAVLDAVTVLCSAVRAAGFSAPLRLRMSEAALVNEPFRQLAQAGESLRLAASSGEAVASVQAVSHLRALLAECRTATDSVLEHLEEFGISLHIVFDVDQLRLRCERIEHLLDLLMAEQHQSAQELRRLLLVWVAALRATRSVRELVTEQSRQLSRRVAERSAETGEHYITRTRQEYAAMLRAALGGGAVIAGTTFLKFAIGALGLAMFWGGFWSGIVYAASFVVVMLMHWTVATKQPAMTAPAMAAKLPAEHAARGLAAQDAAAFVDEVTHLIRSQMAGIVGNLAACFPLVLGVQALAQLTFGQPLFGAESAQYTLASLNLLGPTPLYAAFTGILLFASSLIAGWVENWFVFHRLHSAVRWNPWLLARLGAGRCQRWADWWRTHISGIAANISLGLLLGLVPVFLQFLAIPLDVRHVTLSTGQIAMALGALGLNVLSEPDFWWCLAAIPIIGLLNLSVSFLLAFRVALRARNLQFSQRSEIYRAIRRRLVQAPWSFVLPPRTS